MLDRVSLKQSAKEQIRGNIGTLFLCYLIYWLIISASMITIVGPIFLIYPMAIGLTMMYMGMTRGEKPTLEGMFRPFKGMFWKSVLTYLLMDLFTALWSLLFLIPGYIKAISYIFAPYILVDNPEMSAREAITASKEMTKGHKGELFMLLLSFIPWILLSTVTLGLGYIYVVPYSQATLTNAYFSLKRNAVPLSSAI